MVSRMADIFISYKSERRKAAAHFAKILERYGYSVWYDYSLVKGLEARRLPSAPGWPSRTALDFKGRKARKATKGKNRTAAAKAA
jgi:hypothetical protein